MWRIIRRILLLFAVFIAGIAVFSKLINHEDKVAAEEISAASDPVIYFIKDDTPYNRLCGYTDELKTGTVRDSVTPIGEDRTLGVYINTNGASISAVSYKVRDLLEGHLIQNTDADRIEIASDYVQFDLVVQDLLEDETEYELEIIVTTDEKEFHYYTMVVDEPESGTDECIEGAIAFHEAQFSENGYDEIFSHMETTYSSNSLWQVDLNDSTDQVRWGTLNASDLVRESEPLIRITECGDAYNVITLDYILSYEDADNKYYFEVSEYYRMRWDSNENKEYILNFERTCNELFTGTNCRIEENALNFGITNPDIDYMYSESASTVGFVQQGELWSYNLNDNRLSRAFSFRDSAYTDLDDTIGDYDLRILKIKDSGDIIFAVRGYMERGTHESRSGVCVYRFNSVSDTLEELLFVPSHLSGKMTMAEVGQVMYVMDDNKFVMSAGSDIYCIDLETLEYETVVQNVESDTLCVTDDGRYAAWTEKDTNGLSGRIMIADFETMETTVVQTESADYIKPIDFWGEDLVTGEAYAEDVQSGAGGLGFLMSYINILSVGEGDIGTLEKSYHEDGIYISDIEFSGGDILLTRYEKTAEGYKETEQDAIMNQAMHESQYVYVEERVDETKETEQWLAFSMEIPEATASVSYSSAIVLEEDREVDIDGDFMDSSYYVYAKGGLETATDFLSTAIIAADEQRGVVTDENQILVWSRNKETSVSETTVKNSDVSVANDPAGNGAVNIVGCTLSQALYFVSEGDLLCGTYEGGRNVVVTGYDAEEVYLYFVDDDSRGTVALEDAEENFEESGNRFWVVFK